MTFRGKNWLLGCGVGCLVVAALTAALVGGGAWLLKESFGGWKEASRSQEALHAALGGVDDFYPDPSGKLDPRRVELFLEAQARTAAIRQELGRDLLTVRDEFSQERGRLGRVVQIIKLGSGLAPRLAEYTQARSRTLLELGMNPGEYLYWHSLVYHCWLGHDPAAGVGDLVAVLRGHGGGMQIKLGSSDDGDDPADDAPGQIRRDMQARHRRWLQATLQKMPEDGSAAGEAWRAAVLAELDRLATWPEAMPWTLTFPDAWDEVLDGFQADLIAGWSETGNMIELVGLD